MSAVVDLAALERHGIKLPDGLVERALREVLGTGRRQGSFSAGRIDDARDLPPAAAELDRLVRTELIDPLGRRGRLRFRLSFLKAGDGDAPPDQAFAPSAMDGAPSVFRVLLNLSEYPRRTLLWRGEDDDAPPAEVLIPSRRCGAVHALHYVASKVPHCGLNDALGYFLASYEAPMPA
jgi:hypothetical protein